MQDFPDNRFLIFVQLFVAFVTKKLFNTFNLQIRLTDGRLFCAMSISCTVKASWPHFSNQFWMAGVYFTMHFFAANLQT